MRFFGLFWSLSVTLPDEKQCTPDIRIKAHYEEHNRRCIGSPWFCHNTGYQNKILNNWILTRIRFSPPNRTFRKLQIGGILLHHILGIGHGHPVWYVLLTSSMGKKLGCKQTAATKNGGWRIVRLCSLLRPSRQYNKNRTKRDLSSSLYYENRFVQSKQSRVFIANGAVKVWWTRDQSVHWYDGSGFH